METRKILVILVLALGLMVCWPRTVGGAEPMSSAFTYQGQLYDANYVANGLYDFQFKLWTDPCRSEALFKIGDDVNIPNVDVIDGYFTVELDGFMPIPWWAFDGNARWLEIGIRPGDLNDPNVYSVLSPRQEITPTPYAIYGLRSDYAGSAGDAGTLGGYYYTDFAWSVHTHSGSDIDSGAVGEGYIDGLIARDSEIMSWVLAGDGSGSGLDADLLDGQDSAAFAAVSHSHDGVYALVTHNHDSSYSPIGHNHDGSYAPIIHEHDDRYYSESESDSRFVNVTGDSISASSDGQVLRVSNTGTHYGITAIAGGIYGRAVYGSATNSGDVTNYGGYFKADGNTARAVYGEASNNGNSYNYGGYFVADGNTGRGVYG